MGEKRAEVRIPLMARVDILWEDAERTPRITPAILEDRSQGGLSVRIKTQIPVGTHVTVRWGSQQVSGTVKNCRRNRTGYVMGVKRELVQSLD
jgi:PilZ domain